jgi:predicted porin
MKKTLIALAVIATAGIASAQTATLSGNYSFGYKHTKTSIGTTGVDPTLKAIVSTPAPAGPGLKNGKSAGFGTDDANIKFAVTEDLGGGLKVQAQVSAAGLKRGDSVKGEDASVTLITGAGGFTFGTVESPNSIIGRGQAGAPTYAFDDNIALIGGQNVDLVRYTVPVGPVTIKAAYFDGLGLGDGTQGGGARQPGYGLGVDYTTGPVDATIDYTVYAKRSSANGVHVPNSGDKVYTRPSTALKDRLRLAASYDFGIVKLGGGYARYSGATTSVKRTEMTYGISAPVGPVTVGASFVRTKDNGISVPASPTFNSKVDAFSVGASYALSKRTNLTTRFGSEKIANGASSLGGVKITTYDLVVHHSF